MASLYALYSAPQSSRRTKEATAGRLDVCMEIHQEIIGIVFFGFKL